MIFQFIKTFEESKSSSVFSLISQPSYELRNISKMNTIFLLFLGTLCTLGLSYQVNEQEPPLPKLPLRPGDLLRSLDALTSDAQVIYSPLQKLPLKQAERRVYHDDESNSDNQESPLEAEYDYDKAYENFVNKYFAKGQEELESEDEFNNNDNEDDSLDEKAEEIVDAAPYGFLDATEAEAKDEEEGKEESSKTCERIKIGNQNCKICEDPRTNEKSKTCSYSSDDKPKSFGYSKHRSTKHSSDDDDEDEDDDDGKNSETKRSLKREASQNNKSKFQPRRTNIEQFLKPPSFDDTQPKCTRKVEDGMICFYCESTTERLENTKECLVDKNNLKKRRLDESSKKGTTTKKIFKRMVKYSFKNDDEPKIKENTYSVLQGY